MKLNGRWFPQIVHRDSGNLYPIYHVYPPFPCSDFYPKGGGGGGVLSKINKKLISCKVNKAK